MKHIFLIIFYPARAASSSGCFLGFVVAFAYIAIVVVTAITLLFNAIGSCEGGDYGNDNYNGGGTSTYYTNPNPHQQEENYTSEDNSKSSQSYTMSVTSVIVSLHNQGYKTGQIKKYLKKKGYGKYTRKQIKQITKR